MLRYSLWLRLLALVLLGVAIYNAQGLYRGVIEYAFLKELPLDVPVIYVLMTRGLWAAGFGGLAWGVWQHWSWARWSTLAAVVIYIGQGWLNRLGWGLSDYALQTTPWGLGAGILAVGLTAWLVGRRSPWR
jgi:hypothetical protein